jgi:hypothetical protein
MSDDSALALLWAVLGGNRGYHVIELAEWEGRRLDLWCDVTNRRRFERLCAHHGWASGVTVSARPYADLKSRRLHADAGAVWVCCESSRQVRALEAFDPEPSLVLRAGGTVTHWAFWGITRALSPEEGEKVNRHLAHRLRAPKKNATQMFFPPPGSILRSHGKPKPVVVVGGTWEPHAIGHVCRTLPRTIPDPLKWKERQGARRAL